jgi:hypothetical protein
LAEVTSIVAGARARIASRNDLGRERLATCVAGFHGAEGQSLRESRRWDCHPSAWTRHGIAAHDVLKQAGCHVTLTALSVPLVKER